MRFFDDGATGRAEGKQIGKDQVVPTLEPQGFAPVEVVWNTQGMPAGKRIIRVVVDPDKKITARDLKTPNSATREFVIK